MTVLVTGFAGYGGRRDNPSAEVAGALAGTRLAGLAVETRVLPVVHAGIEGRVAELMALRPVVVVSTGLWPGETAVRLERQAINAHDSGAPDNEGVILSGPVRAGGPATLPATLPLAPIGARLLAAGIPCRYSDSAGGYLCNALMYHLLAGSADLPDPPPVGFVHLPFTAPQVAAMIEGEPGAADLPSMRLEVMLAAVRLAVETTLEGAAAAA